MAKRRIGGAGGGSDKGQRTAGAVLAGVALTGGIAYGGGAAGGGAAGGGTAPGITARAIANKADAKKIANSGKGNPWSRMGLRAGKQVARSTANCVAHSYSEIQSYFLSTPCRSLTRKLYPVLLPDGTTVAVSVVWVGFRTRAQAQDFARVHGVHGNGDIRPLATSLLGLANVAFTAHNYDSRVSGTSVVIAEAEAVGGGADHEVLDAIAEVAAAFPKP